MNPTFKNIDGSPADVRLRKVPLNDLKLLAGDTKDEDKAVLCVLPQGRSPEEVRAVYNGLDDDSKFEVWASGLELNEDNLKRYTERKKKLAEASGLNIDKMVARMVEKKMEESMASLDSSAKGTASETSSTNTVPMNSATSATGTSES